MIVIAIPCWQVSLCYDIGLQQQREENDTGHCQYSFKSKLQIKYQIQNMLAKKRCVPVKKNMVKKKSHKISHDQADTINTTKEKTFATIEQTFDFQDHKTSTRTTHYTSRRDCLDKMQANKLSPFSSPGKSVSPKQRKSVSPIVVKQKQQKRSKKKQLLESASHLKKNIINSSKAPKTRKTKVQNVQKVQPSFQNQFLKRFTGRKITQVSQEEMQASIRKLSKPTLAIKREVLIKSKRNKNEIIKQMHSKIKQKYRKEYPNLKFPQIRLLSAVVLIQRLWRQTKVKMMIGQFLSPRNISLTHPYSQTFGKMPLKNLNQDSNGNLIQEVQHQETMKTEKSFPSLSPRSTKLILKQQSPKNVSDLSSIENNSQLLVTPERSSINLKDLEVSEEFSDVSSTKAKDIMKYVQMYHQVAIKQKMGRKKKKNITRPNTFNFPQSLSQKCLLQSFYKKRISNLQSLKEKGHFKDENVDIFLPSRSIEKAKQQYISPKKPEIVELEQRFYTEAQDEEYTSKIQKEQIKLQEQTVSSIGNVASKIIQFLIFEFSQQFQAFTSKKCLKKKKRLPGIIVNQGTISTYLSQFITFIRGQYENHLEHAFTKIDGKNFLKFLRIPSDQGLFESGEEQDDQEQLNCPILPISAFFQYQPIYQEKIFKIKEEDKKFSNFLEGLIKIHNKCLADSFSDYFQKQRLESIRFPWDEFAPTKSEDKIAEEASRKIENKIKQISNRVISISNTKLGRLHKRDAEQEQINLLQSLKEDYKRQGHDWSEHQEKLEVRLELSQLITQQLIQQMRVEMEALTSSQVIL